MATTIHHQVGNVHKEQIPESHETGNPRERQPEDSYHGHPNYWMTWSFLVGMLVLSLAAAMLGNKVLAMTLIFGMAIIKTLLVVSNFMHVRFEPRAIWVISIFAVLCLFFFFFGVYPDLIWVNLQLAK